MSQSFVELRSILYLRSGRTPSAHFCLAGLLVNRNIFTTAGYFATAGSSEKSKVAELFLAGIGTWERYEVATLLDRLMRGETPLSIELLIEHIK